MRFIFYIAFLYFLMGGSNQYALGADETGEVDFWSQPQERIEEIVKKLKKTADYHKPMKLEIRLDLNLDNYGSPADAIFPWDPRNPTPQRILLVTYGLLEITQNQDEAACVIAHEMGHFILNHYRRWRSQKREMYHQWRRDEEPEGRRRKELEDDFLNEKLKDILDMQKEMEFEADAQSVKLVFEAGYDPEQCSQPILKFAQLTQADLSGDASHPDVQERIRRMNSLAEELTVVQD